MGIRRSGIGGGQLWALAKLTDHTSEPDLSAPAAIVRYFNPVSLSLRGDAGEAFA
jgi:hypothetical protein